MPHTLDRRFCVAPMMDCTDQHERYFLRLISRHAVLYTEMVTASAILHGDLERLLGFNEEEHPVALQLGGSDPGDLAAAARIGTDFGYDEINLNVGCPSDRVQSGGFGACLMAEPELVSACVSAMQEVTTVPVTVKTRIGIDDQDSYEALCEFVERVRGGGCRTFIFHARKAWLQGLSPKENREIPPLKYETVYRLKADYPDLEVLINGGIRTLEAVSEQLEHVDGVMMGRAAYENPYLLADVDTAIYGEAGGARSRREVVTAFAEYAERQTQRGARLHQMTRHITGLYSGIPGARRWRRHLTEEAVKDRASPSLIEEAANFVDDCAEAA
ncbi:MAG: tRNA dihydrouridine(20/20a) synthase DusA [Gemmatimonadetes bacterium]|nr:tRNA dihydrouridine(20/20a) synthase DusA [Gemmatimonadota bacterium]